MKNTKILLSLLIIISFVTCKSNSTQPDEENDPIKDMKFVGTGTIANTKVDIYTDASIEVGYCKFFLKLSDNSSKKLFNDANVSIKTLMDMGNMKHSSPTENPKSTKANEGLFECAAVFIMSGKWEVTVMVKNNTNNDEGEFKLELDIAPSNRVKKVDGADSKQYFITLIQPMTPKVGINDFMIGIHTKENMMSFPPVTDLTVEMEPSMPSMGHGSPNNVNPVHQELGHYLGKVNFTMTGDWIIELQMNRTDSLLYTKFDITLK